VNLSDAPEYLTIPQMAAVLQVPVATIYRWRHSGRGRAASASRADTSASNAPTLKPSCGRARTTHCRRRAGWPDGLDQEAPRWQVACPLPRP